MKYIEIFSKNSQVLNFIKLHPVGSELFHADGETDSLKVTVGFRIFANSPVAIKVGRYLVTRLPYTVWNI
jgi:hypothetical protein